jgi:hypothetical protein
MSDHALKMKIRASGGSLWWITIRHYSDSFWPGSQHLHGSYERRWLPSIDHIRFDFALVAAIYGSRIFTTIDCRLLAKTRDNLCTTGCDRIVPSNKCKTIQVMLVSSCGVASLRRSWIPNTFSYRLLRRWDQAVLIQLATMANQALDSCFSRDHELAFRSVAKH